MKHVFFTLPVSPELVSIIFNRRVPMMSIPVTSDVTPLPEPAPDEIKLGSTY